MPTQGRTAGGTMTHTATITIHCHYEEMAIDDDTPYAYFGIDPRPGGLIVARHWCYGRKRWLYRVVTETEITQGLFVEDK